MKRVAIFGVGLIGGSFALALRRAGFQGDIIGVSSPRTIEEAVSREVIDRGATLEEAAATADLIYLAQPIRQILETIPRLQDTLGPAGLVTDAGSTKAEIMAAMRKHLPAGRFVGGHPLAGKESRGVASADANLFRGKTYVVTPEGDVPSLMVDWLARIGAVVAVMKPEEHDRVVAYTSHLTQLVSTALAATVGQALPGDEIRVSGPGLVDMTRLALSPYDVWRDILDTNRGEVDAALQRMIEQLEAVRASLDTTGEHFERGSALRQRLVRSILLH